MFREPRAHYVKNISLLLLAVLCPFVCMIFSLPLPNSHAQREVVSYYVRNLAAYFRENIFSLIIFFILVSSAFTSYFLGVIIRRRFDRNREAALLSIRVGNFFLLTAVYILTHSQVLLVFSTHRMWLNYVADASLMLMPHLFFSFCCMIYHKKWLNYIEWFFVVLSPFYFLTGIFRLPNVLTTLSVNLMHMLLIGLIFICAILHIRNLSGSKQKSSLFFIILTYCQLPVLVASGVFYALQWERMFFLCFGSVFIIMVVLLFSEILNISARRYIKSTDLENFRKMAYTDGLCNIANRNAFILEQESSFDCDELCYVVFDVNNLKGVNDKYGHAEGDKLIKKSAELIDVSFAEIGPCFRIGGDEFAVIGRYKTLSQIRKCIKLFNRHIAEYNKTATLPLNLAYGYALRENTDISTFELFNKADKEMYRFKRRGKAFNKAL